MKRNSASALDFFRNHTILKAVADYEVGPDAEIPLDLVAEAIATVGRIVEFVTLLLR
jgi:hypothetical protein